MQHFFTGFFHLFFRFFGSWMLTDFSSRSSPVTMDAFRSVPMSLQNPHPDR